MNEIIHPEAVTEEVATEPVTTPEPTTAPEADETDEDEDEDEDEDTATAKPDTTAPSLEERMLEMLLKETHPDTLTTALANGKTIRGAWKYVVSVMKNAYITAHGRVSGGMCGSPEIVLAIAERYLREFPEGYTEPETKHEPKKTEANRDKIIKTVKKAAKDAKEEKKKSKAEQVRELFGGTQLSLFR